MDQTPTPIRIPLDDAATVSGLLLVPKAAMAAYVFAPGAGAGIAHSFMEAMAEALAERRIATLRYQFPYMEQGGKRPDRPEVAHRAVRSACTEAAHRFRELPLIAGGKSFGGRMTSQAQSEEPIDSVRGLAFLGFPLHPAGKPSIERAAHLERVNVPMLFLQGTRDPLADLDLLQPIVDGLSAPTMLHLVSDADHSFHVPARTGRSDADVRGQLAAALAAFAFGL